MNASVMSEKTFMIRYVVSKNKLHSKDISH